MDEELRKILKYLRLGGLLADWDELLAKARRGRFSHERLLRHVLEAEYRVKMENARLLRRKRAHIPEMLEIETFPFDQVLQMVLKSEIRDSMTVLAVLYAARQLGL